MQLLMAVIVMHVKATKGAPLALTLITSSPNLSCLLEIIAVGFPPLGLTPSLYCTDATNGIPPLLLANSE
jgi:hypothetical protein